MRTRSRINLAGRLRSGVQQSPLPPPPPPTAAPVAAFTGTPLSGSAPLTVAFTDASTGVITSRSFAFGDGSTTGDKVGNHTYAAGTYSPALTVNGPGGTNTLTRTNYVTASADPPGLIFRYLTPYTDLAGTVAAGVGDPVRSIRDTEGNPRATLGGGTPPTLQSAGGHLYVVGDGVAWFSTTGFLALDVSKTSWYAVAYRLTDATTRTYPYQINSAFVTGTWRAYSATGDDGAYPKFTTEIDAFAMPDAAAGTQDVVALVRLDGNATGANGFKAWINDQVIEGANPDSTAASITGGVFYPFSPDFTAFGLPPFQGRIYLGSQMCGEVPLGTFTDQNAAAILTYLRGLVETVSHSPSGTGRLDTGSSPPPPPPPPPP